jgi:hypothetical protein
MIEKAREAVEGFTDLCEKTEQKLSLTVYTFSSGSNYLRELARILLALTLSRIILPRNK